MSETPWTHLAMFGTMLVPLIVIWIDLRHRGNQQHTENRDRLVRIETKVEPIWTWWNKTNGH